MWVVTFCIDYSEGIAGWVQPCSRRGLKETPRKEHCVYRTEWGWVSWTKGIEVGKSLYLYPAVTWASVYLNPCLHFLRVEQFLKTVDGMLTSQTGALALQWIPVKKFYVYPLAPWSLRVLLATWSTVWLRHHSIKQTALFSVVKSTDCSRCAPQWRFRVCHVKIPQTCNIQSCLLESLRRWISDSDSIYTHLPIFVTLSTVS